MSAAAPTAAMPGLSRSRYGFGQVARMEWIKLSSVRSTPALLACTLLAMVATGIGVGLGYRSHTPVAAAVQIVNNSLGGAALAQVLIGALGATVVTGEYSSGMVRATFAAIPHRGLVLAARTATFGVVAFAVGELATVAGFVAGPIAISGSPVPRASIGDPAVQRPVLLTGAYLGLVGLLGLGLGTIIRHPGGAIGALVGGQFVPLILAALFGQAGIAVLKFIPLFILANSVAVVTPVPGALSAWAGIGVLCGYVVLALGLGWCLVLRRDA
jgi:ABC-2 type transport system permease protein